MTYASSHALVSTEWLANHLEAPDVRVVDASCICRLPAAMDAPNITANIFPVLSILISTISRQRVAPAPYAAEPQNSPARSGVSAWAMGIASSSMTASVAVPQPHGSGGCSASSAMTMCLSSTAASQWLAKDAPPATCRRCARASFTPHVNQMLVRNKNRCSPICKAGMIRSSMPARRRGLPVLKGAVAPQEGWPHPRGAQCAVDSMIDDTSKTLLPADTLKAHFWRPASTGQTDRRQLRIGSHGLHVSPVALCLGKPDVAVYDGSGRMGPGQRHAG